MTVRTDVVVDWELSPRIIEVADPSIEITIQDLHDTLRSLEDNQLTTDDNSIIDTAGKEELGGGVSVGLTSTLQDAQLSFQARTTAEETGTATSTGTLTLIDTTALFQTNGIKKGAFLINFGDRSVTTVISIDSEIQLTHQPLAGGVADDWTVGDNYSVKNEIQCEVSGGNLVAVDASQVAMASIFPTVGVQVKTTASSSATQSDLEAIQFASFSNAVWVDVTNSTTGTVYPIGNAENPVNNLADAHIIATARGFRKFEILKSMTIDGGLDYSDGHIFKGFSPVTVTITVDPSANVLNCEFTDAQITGTLDGNSVFREDIVGTVNYINGFIEHCTLAGVITLGGGADAAIHGCFQQTGAVVPEINMGGTGQTLVLSDWSGDILITNKTDAGTSFISGEGAVTIDATVTAGTFNIHGGMQVIDNSTGTAVVNNNTIQSLVWEEKLIDHAVAGTTGKALRNAGSFTLTDGQAQAGTAGTITLAATASSTDDIYTDQTLFLTDGTGVGQVKSIINYDGTTKIATIVPGWIIVPDATSDYEIVPGVVHTASGWDTLHECYTVSATAGTITISTRASAINDYYIEQQILIHSGTGNGQVRIITDYDGPTRVITMNRDWDTIPDTTSQYVIQPDSHAPYIAERVWDRIIDGTFTAEEVMRLIAAATAAKLNGAETTTINIRDLADSKNRIVATVDANGNRTAVTHDVSL